MVYDISSSIKNEKGIKLFTIKLGTSEKNIDKSIELINKNIENVKSLKGIFSNEIINKIIKNIQLKEELRVERSIELCKKITSHEIMYNPYNIISQEIIGDINEEKILNVVNKVLKDPTIQILRPE